MSPLRIGIHTSRAGCLYNSAERAQKLGANRSALAAFARDRHANIGKGNIGEEGFGRMLRHPALRTKPFILETPGEEEGHHQRDIDTLRRLAAEIKPGEKRNNAGKAVRLSGNRNEMGSRVASS